MSSNRIPSLHIKLSDLEKLLGKREANKLMKLCAPYSVSTRSAMITNNRLETKAEKLIKSSRLDSDLLSDLIYTIRKQMKHRGISRIKPGGKDWETVKEITSNALDFCNEFNLTRRKGFITYLEIGMAKINK